MNISTLRFIAAFLMHRFMYATFLLTGLLCPRLVGAMERRHHAARRMRSAGESEEISVRRFTR